MNWPFRRRTLDPPDDGGLRLGITASGTFFDLEERDSDVARLATAQASRANQRAADQASRAVEAERRRAFEAVVDEQSDLEFADNRTRAARRGA